MSMLNRRTQPLDPAVLQSLTGPAQPMAQPARQTEPLKEPASLPADTLRPLGAAKSATADINKQVAEGTAAGVSGTPSFIIGKVENGQLDGVRLVGAMPYASFDAKIQELLAAAGK